ncbi:cellulase family glycosylhydrolase [Saxibacter everestensis]|uniref:Cellulase family glycosylhydrolase n=1 Tax=Saxibacter everestensis TaxID=2909229 RepID=A0ABY8QS11_9MICO|nr:cellulase family glycosylhydrolase [Brevibacteriaceae bacterium ZFBP1038]
MTKHLNPRPPRQRRRLLPAVLGRDRSRRIRNLVAGLAVVGAIVLTGSASIVRAPGQPPEQASSASPAVNDALPPLDSGIGFGFTGSLDSRPGAADDIESFKRDVDALVEHGQQWIRFGIIGWQVARVSGDDGHLVWDESRLKVFDEAIAYARQKGLRVFLTTADGQNAAGTAEAYRTSMREYWTTLARRYAPRVSVWQLYNEVDGSHFRTDQQLKSMTPEYLAQLKAMLQIGRTAIKEASPETLVTTNTSGWPVDDAMEADWNTFFDAISATLDVIAVDVYPADDTTDIEGLTSRVERISQRYDKPVIVAEVGLQTCRGCWSEADQGRYVAAAVEALKEAEPMAILIYQWRDGKDPDGLNAFGVIHIDRSPKAGFDRIMAAMRD